MLYASVVLSLVPALGVAGLAHSQSAAMPGAVRTLDAAATKLFDTAERGKWSAVVPRIDTLLFLERRMRLALTWSDVSSLKNTQDAFTRLWSSLRRKGQDSSHESRINLKESSTK